MTEALRRLVMNAPLKRYGTFRYLLFIPDGEYDGFWGLNGFDKMIILGKDDESGEWVNITGPDAVDKFNMYAIRGNFNLDIPSDWGVPRIWFNKPIEINYTDHVSDVVGELIY